MSGYLPGVPSTPAALSHQGVKLARAHLNDGKFAGDKKTVERHQESDGEQFEKDHAGCVSQATAALARSTVSTALMETPVAYAVAKWTFMR